MLAVPEFTFWSGPSRESSRSSLLLSYDGVRQPRLADATHEDVRRRYPCVSNSTAETPAIVSTSIWRETCSPYLHTLIDAQSTIAFNKA